MSIIDRLNEQSTGLETYHNRVSNMMNNFDLEKGIFDQTQEAKKADEKSSLQAIKQKQLDAEGLVAPLVGSALKTGKVIAKNKFISSGASDFVDKKTGEAKAKLGEIGQNIKDSIKEKFDNFTSKGSNAVPEEEGVPSAQREIPQQMNEAFNPDTAEPVAQRGGAAARPSEGVPGQGEVTGDQFQRVRSGPEVRAETGGPAQDDRPPPAAAAPTEPEGEPAAATAEREASTGLSGLEKEGESLAEGEGGAGGLAAAAIGAASTLAGKGSAGQKAGALGKLGAEGAGIEAASAALPGAGEILAGAIGIGALIYDHRQKQREEASDAASDAAAATTAPRAPQMGGVAFNAAPVLDSSDFHSL